eukprot:SAG31_NODE_1810_length_7224_cov_1.969965_6_plen_175_part_00
MKRSSGHKSVALGEIEQSCWIVIIVVTVVLTVLSILIGVFVESDHTLVHDDSDVFVTCPVHAVDDGLTVCPEITNELVEQSIDTPCIISHCELANLASWWIEHCSSVIEGVFVSNCLASGAASPTLSRNDQVTECERQDAVRKGECVIFYDDSSPFFDMKTAWETVRFVQAYSN